MQPVVYFVGDDQTVGHHAAPLEPHLDVRILPSDQVVRQAKPGDVAVFYSEHFDGFRECCLRLKQNQVATLYMIDGILEWRNAWCNSPNEVACPFTMRPALAHKVACIGAAQARTLAGWGNADKVEVVGIPRLENLPAATLRPSDGKFRILVMTAKTPAFTEQQLATVKRSLKDVADWGRDNETIDGRQVEWVWRLTRGLEAELDVLNCLADLQGADLHQVLQNVDAVITTPSTAAIEAMRLHLPVAQLDYHNCPHYLQTGWAIATGEHIEATVRSMAGRDAARMHFQSDQLADAVYFESSATQRLKELIVKMSDIAGEQIQAGQPIEFPPNLLPVPKTSLVNFDHESLFEGDAFKQRDTGVLQVQLEHSRREVEHLNREIDQLQAELNQAHQIFETISSHPIAGPVVRIRQKMLDLMARIRAHKESNAADGSPPAPFQNPTEPDSKK
jgi:hypothetical protein